MEYGKRSDDSASESWESPTGEVVLRAKEEEGGSDNNPGSEPRTSTHKESSVVKQTRANWEGGNKNSPKTSWNANGGGKIKPKERKDIERGRDRSSWKEWKGNWRCHAAEVASNVGDGDRRGKKREARGSILPRYKKVLNPKEP